MPEAQHQFGDIGKTAFYSAVERYDIKLVRLGGRSLVPMSDIERVVADLMADSTTAPEVGEKAEALAVKSVEARRKRRGNGNAAS